MPLNDYFAPYLDDIVPSRLGIYSKDGNMYGAPTHVGATVAFYYVEILEDAGMTTVTSRPGTTSQKLAAS